MGPEQSEHQLFLCIGSLRQSVFVKRNEMHYMRMQHMQASQSANNWWVKTIKASKIIQLSSLWFHCLSDEKSTGPYEMVLHCWGSRGTQNCCFVSLQEHFGVS